MGAGRRTQTFVLNESAVSPTKQAISHRNLRKNHLGGVVFGCKNSTIKECLFKQLFGLPTQHFPYVKNIDPGLPLFLFNYSDRKLHGIFEAASSGQMNINPYAWTTDGSERTLFPAQVQIHVRLRCHPLPEEQFKPIIIDNYYTQNHFWFELDHAQTSRLVSLLSAVAVSPSTYAPQNTKKWRTLFQAVPSLARMEEIEASKPTSHSRTEETEISKSPSHATDARMEEIEVFNPPSFEIEFPCSSKSNGSCSSDVTTSLDANSHPSEDCLDKQVVEKEKDLVHMKLKELVLSRELSDLPLTDIDDSSALNEVHFGERNEESRAGLFDYPSIAIQLFQEMEELKTFKEEQIHKMGCIEKKLVEAETEIQQLKRRCMILESTSQTSVARVDEMTMDSYNDLKLDLNELVFLVGGYDGETWLSALDSYSPTHDVIKSLKPMNSIRSYASVARLNGELYVFGGGNGCFWYDTVESYNPANNQWTLCPSLNVEKGSLAGATLNNRIFAVGGGNGVECFAEVEMLDLDVGRWIPTRSMLQKRFALAAAEFNGALYAVGGYDGKDYLKSAERFDPREHSWTRIEGMNTKRGCHSMVVLNEKLYAIGGYDGNAMVPSVEIFDPRLGSWMTGEPMDQSRGYSASAVFKDSIYVIGGVKTGDTIVDTVERYEEGKGWHVTNLRAIGERCFFSAIVL